MQNLVEPFRHQSTDSICIFLKRIASRFSGDYDGMTQQADGSYAAKWGSQRGIVYRSEMKPGKKGLFLCFFPCFFAFQFIWLQQQLFNSLLQWTSVSSCCITFLKMRTNADPNFITFGSFSMNLQSYLWEKTSSHPHGPENPMMPSGVRMDAGGQHLVVAMISRSAFQCSRILGGNFKRSCSGVLDDVGSGTLEPLL